MVWATGYDVAMDAETESARGLATVDLGAGGPIQLEFHQLELRYEALRRRAPEQEKRLLASLAQHGQQAPIVVVGSEDGRAVVVDGYKRLRALRQLKADTVLVTTWELGEAEALMLERLMRTAGRDDAFEQAWLLRELGQRFGLSGGAVAPLRQEPKLGLPPPLARGPAAGGDPGARAPG